MKICIQIILFFLLLPFPVFSGQVGSQAPSFALKDLTGETITLDSLQGKVVFLGFWAIWCRSCREELPELDRLYLKYKDNGFTVIGISVDAPRARVAAFLKKVPVAFPILIDEKGDVAEAYRFSELPSGFLIGRDGVIKYEYKGYDKSFPLLYEKEISGLLKQ